LDQWKEGILTETDVLVKNGKIAAIGNNLWCFSNIIDAKGKHLTSGIIDEHSHIAISSGVNEGGHNSSAEVTIQRCCKFRRCKYLQRTSWRCTTSHCYGSAPIGGRSAVKWKWGAAPDEMLYKNQPGL
jgi:formylmethanofuran dehydrogenase subunit A